MRRSLHGRVELLSGALLLAARMGYAVCASTPAVAVSLNEANGGEVLQGDDGYRVTSVRWDPVLRQGWAMVARCGHPEWPEIALPTKAQRYVKESVVATAAPLVVKAGDTVRLWRVEHSLRIELEAVAEESGGVGKSIRVRLVRTGMEGQAERQIVGVVRGLGDVEMQQ